MDVQHADRFDLTGRQHKELGDLLFRHQRQRFGGKLLGIRNLRAAGHHLAGRPVLEAAFQ